MPSGGGPSCGCPFLRVGLGSLFLRLMIGGRPITTVGVFWPGPDM